MRSTGLSFSTIPERGQRVLLSAISNISFGAETANVSDLISKEIKETALRAVAAIPGLFTGGVDLIVTGLHDRNPKVLEVNSFPHATSFIYPTYGESINPIAQYLDAYYAQLKFSRGGDAAYTAWEKELLESWLDFSKMKVALSAVE